MRTGDFSSDLYGVPLPSGTQVLYNPYSIVGPNGRDPFMCDGTGNPEPVAANGTQAPGTPCNKLPAGLINPITSQIMLSPGFILCPLRASHRARASTFPMCQCGNSTKSNACMAVSPKPTMLSNEGESSAAGEAEYPL